MMSYKYDLDITKKGISVFGVFWTQLHFPLSLESVVVAEILIHSNYYFEYFLSVLHHFNCISSVRPISSIEIDAL